MPCYRPIVMTKCGKTKNGKDKYKIVKNFSFNYEDYRSDDYVLVPCNRCIGCRLDYANHWAERCSLEASLYEQNMFLTLTYNDENVPLKVSKKHFQLFIKRLRNFFNDDKIRYFGCGEYGSQTHRPHYHIIVFGVCFDDLKKRGKSPSGEYIYNSESLEKLWPYGYSSIGMAEYNSMAYTARYVMKKLKGSVQSDEFVLMSRRPGIGYEYFIKNQDKIKELDKIYFPFNESKKQTTLFRYYKSLIEKDSPDYFTQKKPEILASIIQNTESLKQAVGVKSEYELKKMQENIKKEQIKALKRGL